MMDYIMNEYVYYLPLALTLVYFVTQPLLNKMRNLPPTPFPSLPIVGHLYLMLGKLSNPLHRTLATLSSTHGPILFLRFGAETVIVVSSPPIVEECLLRNDLVFANRPAYLRSPGRLGYDDSYLTWAPYGDHWRNLRLISVQEMLSVHRLQDGHAEREDAVRSFLRRLSVVASGGAEAVEMKTVLFELAYDVMVVRMVTGGKMDDNELADMTKRCMHIAEERSKIGDLTVLGDFIPLLRKMGLFKGLKRRLSAIDVKTSEYLEELLKNQRINKTLLGSLRSLQDSDSKYYTDDYIKSFLLALVLAATDTTAGTLEWGMSLLLNNPKALKKVQQEIDETVGHERLIHEADLKNLPYLHGVILETMRLYPAGPLLVPHESSQDCVVKGYRVPRGTTLLVNVWAMHNDPKLWDEPTKFEPERFNGVDEKRNNNLGYKFIPFGVGRRGCPGEALAMVFVEWAMASLIQCFEWEREGSELVDMKEDPGLNLMKATPLKARLCARQAMMKMLS